MRQKLPYVLAHGELKCIQIGDNGFATKWERWLPVRDSWRDDVGECIAGFAVAGPVIDDTDLLDDAKRLLVDTLAVGLGAFHHPAAVIARNYLTNFPANDGAAIWGTPVRATPDKATLVNGVLLRCYDYNDVMMGRCGGGHPSDMVSALVCAADWRSLSGRKLLSALSVGYEVAEALYDFVPNEAGGWDHANVSALGATCALGNLLGLTFDEMCEALGIAAIEHLQSDEIESSALNKRGDLTMWKRFHGADAMRHALDSCLLAAAGAEGAVRPFRGRLGFLAKFGVTEDPLPFLRERLRPRNYTRAISRTNLKRWPVGSRGQSAIAAAIAARRQMPVGAGIAAVSVLTEPGVYDHLVKIRTDPWRPISRETADHSLPYIVGAAALDGHVDVTSFDLEKVRDPARADFIANNVKIEVSSTLDCRPGAGSRHLSRVEILGEDGRRYVGEAVPAPGHRDNPFGEADLREKLHENGDRLIGAAGVDALYALTRKLEDLPSVRELTSVLAVA